jgi:hypothetical protein
MTCLIAPYSEDIKMCSVLGPIENVNRGIFVRYGYKLPAHKITKEEFEELETLGENFFLRPSPLPIICSR